VSLGVAVLIIVSSVFNGFEKELKEKILNSIPHGNIYGYSSISNPIELIDSLSDMDRLKGAAPYIETQSLIGSKSKLKGTLIYGVDPSYESNVSNVPSNMFVGSFDDLSEGSFNLILGDLLARQLSVSIGDKVTLLLPNPKVSLSGIYPKMKVFSISGIYSMGSNDLDSNYAFINIYDASKLLSLSGNVTGIRLKFDDLFDAPDLTYDALIKAQSYSEQPLRVNDWSSQFGTLWRAVGMERSLVFLLTSLIIVIAAFNVVAMLMMMLNEKKEQIAILKTVGMNDMKIIQIFLYLGLIISFWGISIGTLFGLLVSFFIASSYFDVVISGYLQWYFISYLPTDLRIEWIISIIFGSLLITSFASIYPARSASKIIPAKILK
jgi:lipoprotein-releasing system permease protein